MELNVNKYLQDSLGDPEFCDVKILATDGEVLANKTILSMTSQYFRSMFSGNHNFVEGKTGVVRMPYSKSVLEKVVFYLYGVEMNCEGMTLDCLLDLMELLNLAILHEEFGVVEEVTISKIKKGDFSMYDCLKSLDHCSRLGLETIEEALLTHLKRNFGQFCQDEVVGTLSGDMIIRLLEEKMDPGADHIDRFRTLVTWLSFNAKATEEEELLDQFDFNHFTIEELATDVRMSGLYGKDHIIERMEELNKINLSTLREKSLLTIANMEQRYQKLSRENRENKREVEAKERKIILLETQIKVYQKYHHQKVRKILDSARK